MSVTVAEEGNRRTGDMSSAESAQCTLDIKAWFSRSDAARSLQNGATSVDFQRLEKTIDCEIPFALKTVLSEVNGGIYFMDKKQLNTTQIAATTSRLERTPGWKEGLVPFAGDEDTTLVMDTRYGDVYEWDADGKGDRVAPSMERFLEDYRNNLLSGHFEFLEEVGVIEKMGGKPSRRK